MKPLLVMMHKTSIVRCVLETGVFSNVNITIPYKGVADNTTQMTLGSNLEIVDVLSGKHNIIYKVPYSISGA